MARMLAFVINGLKTGLLFLAVSVNPNPQTRRRHSRLLGKQRRNKRNPSLFPVTRDTKNSGSCPILGRPSTKGLKVLKPQKHFHSSPVANLFKVGCVVYPENSLAARPCECFVKDLDEGDHLEFVLKQPSPTFLAPRINFGEDNSPTDWEEGVIWG